MKRANTTNIRIIGLGGMGILKSSKVLAEAVFRTGFDVKKAEVHGMSQRGGSVTSDIRFGKKIFSPLIPFGEVDFLLVLAPDELDMHQAALRPDGILINSVSFEQIHMPRQGLNIAMLGALSRHLDIPMETWNKTIRDVFPAKLHSPNLDAFQAGRVIQFDHNAISFSGSDSSYAPFVKHKQIFNAGLA